MSAPPCAHLSLGRGLASALGPAMLVACVTTTAPASPPIALLSAVAGPAAAAPPPSTSGRTSANPFDGARLYVNPAYAAEIELAARASADRDRLLRVARYPTAVWLDSIATAPDAGRVLDDAAAPNVDGRPTLVVFAIYDLPNRDCAAASSAGELSVDHDGEALYKTRFIDPIAAQFRAHPSVRVAAVLEPDSLANVATNLDHPKCAAAADVYERCIAYALRALSMPNVSLYLDAAHAGWLGWDGNREKIARIFADVVSLARGEGSLRGFATNVSNYNSLDTRDGAKLEPSDPCPDELTYVQKLRDAVAASGIRAHAFIIDTGRNGRPGIRSKWSSWCNVRGAGLGERPRASPTPGVDAYYWIKPPGESDGVSDPGAPRYDAGCSSPDSAPNAPQAGTLFPAYLERLVALASPPI